MYLSEMSKKYTKDEILIFLMTLFGNCYFNRAIWIIYFSAMGYSLGEIGIFQAIINFAMLIFEIPTGVISDLYGRKNVIIIGRICIIIYMLIIIFFTNNIFMLVLGFILNGIGISFISCSDEALLYNYIKENDKESEATMILGKYSACITIALAIGMGIGGVLEQISWNVVYMVTIVFQLISLVITIFVEESKETREDNFRKDIEKNNMEKSEAKEQSNIKVLIDEVKKFLELDKSLRLIIIGVALYMGFISVYYMFSQEVFYNEDYTVMVISLIYAVENIVSAFVNSTSYKVEEKFDSFKVLKAILLISLFAVILIVFNIKIITLIVFFVISITNSIFSPIIYSQINKNIKSENRATILSILSFFTTLVMLVTFPLIGQISGVIDTNISVAVFGIISVTIAFFNIRKSRYIE